MSSNVVQAPFLRTTRTFPEDSQSLSVETSKSYLDIANAVNTRTIGIFPKNRSVLTGNSWYITSSKQQTLRQIYSFTSAGSIPHGINVSQIAGFVQIYGTFTDGTVWYPLSYVNAVAANNQVSITVTSTNIVITAGGGSPPTITHGYVVLEWISNP